jgi:hypothetical protein
MAVGKRKGRKSKKKRKGASGDAVVPLPQNASRMSGKDAISLPGGKPPKAPGRSSAPAFKQYTASKLSGAPAALQQDPASQMIMSFKKDLDKATMEGTKAYTQMVHYNEKAMERMIRATDTFQTSSIIHTKNISDTIKDNREHLAKSKEDIGTVLTQQQGVLHRMRSELSAEQQGLRAFVQQRKDEFNRNMTNAVQTVAGLKMSADEAAADARTTVTEGVKYIQRTTDEKIEKTKTEHKQAVDALRDDVVRVATEAAVAEGRIAENLGMMYGIEGNAIPDVSFQDDARSERMSSVNGSDLQDPTGMYRSSENDYSDTEEGRILRSLQDANKGDVDMTHPRDRMAFIRGQWVPLDNEINGLTEAFGGVV